MNQQLNERRPDWKDGNLTICKTQNGDGGNFIRIELNHKDLKDGKRVKLEMTMEDFAQAITGLACVPVKIRPAGNMVGFQPIPEPPEPPAMKTCHYCGGTGEDAPGLCNWCEGMGRLPQLTIQEVRPPSEPTTGPQWRVHYKIIPLRVPLSRVLRGDTKQAVKDFCAAVHPTWSIRAITPIAAVPEKPAPGARWTVQFTTPCFSGVHEWDVDAKSEQAALERIKQTYPHIAVVKAVKVENSTPASDLIPWNVYYVSGYNEATKMFMPMARSSEHARELFNQSGFFGRVLRIVPAQGPPPPPAPPSATQGS
jgi:hypothetical protein